MIPVPPLRVTLVGAPNVGKSALFNRLTGRYVTVSNYPGTTVEVSRGQGMLDDRTAEIIDTPGIYSLLPTSDDERVARRVLLDGTTDVVVHVVDAKNLPRMLSLTLQLLELRRPLVLALNMMDEAERIGLHIDRARLAAELGVEVIPLVAVTGAGIPALRDAVARAGRGETRVPLPPVYGNGVGTALRSLRQQ
ncbi:MAG: FeoB small GTPase domain-containing protein, partial [Gemmatimonadales bacterium]|nr:FeoB small GTPase domain-containing protein [Gemmatimonadales bacterium]